MAGISERLGTAGGRLLVDAGQRLIGDGKELIEDPCDTALIVAERLTKD